MNKRYSIEWLFSFKTWYYFFNKILLKENRNKELDLTDVGHFFFHKEFRERCKSVISPESRSIGYFFRTCKLLFDCSLAVAALTTSVLKLYQQTASAFPRGFGCFRRIDRVRRFDGLKQKWAKCSSTIVTPRDWGLF